MGRGKGRDSTADRGVELGRENYKTWTLQRMYLRTKEVKLIYRTVWD